MNIFLKAKHWHLFALMYGPVVIFYTVLMTALFSEMNTMMADMQQTIAEGEQPNPAMFMQPMFERFKYLSVAGLVSISVMYGWLWSVVTGLQEKLPRQAEIKTGVFKVMLFVSLASMMCFTYFMYDIVETVMSSMSEMAASDEPDPRALADLFARTFAIMIPVQLVVMGCTFYCFYVTAKTIKSVELQREATFSDFIVEFVLVWFFFIGVWLLQPRINKMVDGSGQQPGS